MILPRLWHLAQRRFLGVMFTASVLVVWVYSIGVTETVEACLHPFHVTRSEIEFNSDTGRAEVSLSVDPRDLERALTLDFGRRVSLDTGSAQDESNVDRLILQHLAEHFRLRTKASSSPSPLSASLPRLHWVGKEVSFRETWIYFEVELERDLHGVSVEIDLFQSFNPTQSHTVSVRQGRYRRNFTLDRDHRSSTLSIPSADRFVATHASKSARSRRHSDEALLETSCHWIEQYFEASLRNQRDVDRLILLGALSEISVRLDRGDAARVYLLQAIESAEEHRAFDGDRLIRLGQLLADFHSVPGPLWQAGESTTDLAPQRASPQRPESQRPESQSAASQNPQSDRQQSKQHRQLKFLRRWLESSL